jgi:DNA-binding transcriptional ArsR family regulator
MIEQLFNKEATMTNTSTCDCDVIHQEVVSRIQAQMPPKADLERLGALYKMFSDGTRIHILFALGYGEMCVCDLAVLLGMTKSAISHQLKSLRLANLVHSRREGQVIYYALADEHVREILNMGFDHVTE